MNSITLFNSIRLYYLDPTPEGVKKRNEIAGTLSVVKLLTFGSGAIGAVTSLFGWGISNSYPIVGNMLLIAGSIAIIASREIYVIAANAEELCLKTIAERVQAIISVDQFLTLAYKRTWLLEPLTKNIVKSKLTELAS